jgi:hypothetical protein
MLNDTLPHELAHFVSIFLYGKNGDGHNFYWKSVMRWMGISDADRCHEYSLEGVKVRQRHNDYHYSCKCNGITHQLNLRKHERHMFLIHNGNRGMVCRKCKSPIVYKGFMMNGKFIPYVQKPVVNNNNNPPAPIIVPESTPTPVQPTYRSITRFVNGMLVNEKVLVNA